MAASESQRPFPFRIEFPPELPISARADEITAAIAENQVVILAGETGSGKTTLLNCITRYIDEGERIVTCEDAHLHYMKSSTIEGCTKVTHFLILQQH